MKFPVMICLCNDLLSYSTFFFQAKCLLASLTALAVVDKKYAWIVRPRENKQDPMSLVRIYSFKYSCVFVDLFHYCTLYREVIY